MKKKVVLMFLSVILVIALMTTPIFAKDNQSEGQPFQELWDAVTELQQWVASYFVSWADIVGIPTDIADGDDVGITSESDPTVATSVKDGVDWTEVTSIPADIADGDDVGITSESDPTVAASVKDGVDWTELSGIPDGFADGVDDVANTQELLSRIEALEEQVELLTSLHPGSISGTITVVPLAGYTVTSVKVEAYQGAVKVLEADVGVAGGAYKLSPLQNGSYTIEATCIRVKKGMTFESHIFQENVTVTGPLDTSGINFLFQQIL